MSNKSNKDIEKNLMDDSKSESGKEINIMENDISGKDTTKHQRQATSFDADKGKMFKMILTGLLLIVPLVIIVYRMIGNKDVPADIADKTPKSVITEGNDPNLAKITTLENAVKANPDYKNLIDLSLAYINEKKPEKSIEPLKKAIALKPQSAAAYNNIGTAYNMMGRYMDGIVYCSKAVELDSSFQLAKNNLNWVKNEQRNTMLDIKTLEETPEKKRKPDYYIALGMDYLHLQNYDKSIELWNKSIAQNLKAAEATNDIGYAYLTQFKYKEAINYFRKAVEIDPNFQLAKNNLEYALYQQDEFIHMQKGN